MDPSNIFPGGRIKWLRMGDIYPGMRGVEHHFVAQDAAGQDIGVVKRIEYGTEVGQWLWSMTRVHPGKPFLDRSGTEKSRREAALAIVASWRAFLKWYGIEAG